MTSPIFRSIAFGACTPYKALVCASASARKKKKWLFQFPDDAPEPADLVKREVPDDEPSAGHPAPLLKPVGPILVEDAPNEDDPKEVDSSWRATIASGEPQMQEDAFAPESYDTDHHWDPQGRPPWQRHSELGPNLDAEARRLLPEAMQDAVNPLDFDWHAAAQGVNVEHGMANHA